MNAAVQTKVEILKANLANLNPGDRNFAESLMHSVTTQRRPASEKQVYWINTLADRACSPKQPEQRKTADIGDMGGVIEMFDRIGKTRLKHPAIVLYVEEVGDVRLTVATARAQVPGSINVVGSDEGAWFGRIKRDGCFEQSFRHTASTALLTTLRRFAADPLTVAAEHGKLTGRCCFCNRRLTDEKSTALGYGPVCGKAWVGARGN